MEFYVPSIGDVLWLSKPWTFILHGSKGNTHFFRNILIAEGSDPYDTSTEMSWHTSGGREVTLPRGTKLRIDRLYVRKGQFESNKITFYIDEHPNHAGCRFWVKLPDANTITCKLTPISEQKGNSDRFSGIEI